MCDASKHHKIEIEADHVRTGIAITQATPQTFLVPWVRMMTRIRIAAVRNAAALIIICCCMLTQAQATFHSQRLMKGTRNSDTRHISSIFGSNGSSQNQIIKQAKSRIKMNHEVKSSGTVPKGDSFTLQQEVRDEKSFRQRDEQQTQVPSSNNTDGKQKAPTVISTSFTVSPVSTSDKKSNAPVVAPTIAPTTMSVPLGNPLPTSKPIISVPLSVASSTAPTTFFTESTNTPSATRSISPTTLDGGNSITAPPSVVLIVTPVAAPTDDTMNDSDKDAVLENEPSTTSSSGKAESGAIVGVVLAVIVSVIVSIMVLRVRHKYVQKHGAASTRRRRGKAMLQQESDILSDDVDDQRNETTVRIITSNDHDTASPDRTFEIHLDDDEVDNANIYSQESSFISTSGGEEIESDFDQNRTTITKRNIENS